MKKHLIIFLSFTLFSALTAYALDIKKDCYKRCMKEINDKETCEKICKDDE